MKKIIMILSLTLLSYEFLQAKHYKASSERSFDRVVDNNELVVAMFYDHDKDSRDQESDFKDLGKSDKYIAYVSVDLSDKKLHELGAAYSIKATPTFLLIRNGRTYTEHGQKAMLQGEQGPAVLRKFVRSYFGDYRQDLREKKREEARENSPSVSFGVGVGYPGYYGYGPYYGPYYGYPYYGGSGFSFGVGF